MPPGGFGAAFVASVLTIPWRVASPQGPPLFGQKGFWEVIAGEFFGWCGRAVAGGNVRMINELIAEGAFDETIAGMLQAFTVAERIDRKLFDQELRALVGGWKERKNLKVLVSALLYAGKNRPDLILLSEDDCAELLKSNELPFLVSDSYLYAHSFFIAVAKVEKWKRPEEVRELLQDYKKLMKVSGEEFAEAAKLIGEIEEKNK